MLRHVVTFLFSLMIWAGFAPFAVAQTLTNIGFESRSVILELSAPVVPKIFTIDGESPRIVIDIADGGMNIDGKTLKTGGHIIKGRGAVRRIRLAARGQGFRAVVDLEPGTQMKTRLVEGRVITLTLNQAVKTSASTAQAKAPRKVRPRYFENQVPYPRLAPRGIVKVSRKPVIVIDPGHGGRDPGAIGQKGTQEKDITTASARELQRQLLATGRYDVILTRTKDVYVEHEERLRIARAGGADLFISIHADSAGNKSARGATVYTLADRAKNRSKRIVNSQNWIMDVDLTDQSDSVGDILVDLAQRSTSTQSEKFADYLVEGLGSSTRMIRNSHRRAGYYVLLAPDVPAVLLEMGFLSNVRDENLLNSANHRKKVLKSVTRSINKYFDSIG
ncbi:N-acetylmuramoyl-L-alanine amidase [Hellea balneolensis]|uniref:N-acetylmuramoyl-L-alanine amidase n=1 Tax=Hellea balneolensis TaxID=287478 RepID=UPI000402E98D|nr:N-acetylmuramoyl-L-alanine amidase [Hellea balneolensis]